MKYCRRLALGLLALLILTGCASTTVTNQHQVDVGKVPRPNQIWVYDFVATPRDAPVGADVAFQGTQQSPEQVAMGRQLGAQIAQELVVNIHAMGLPAVEATRGSSPQVSDLVIRGYLLSINEGSAVKRVAIGFGAGGQS